MQRIWSRQQNKKVIEELTETFTQVDVDSSGTVTLSELMRAPDDVRQTLLEIADMANLAELFEALDFDQSGEIEVSEFIYGLMQAHKGKPMEFQCLMRQNRTIMESLNLMGQGHMKAEARRRAELHLTESEQTLSL